VSGIRTVRAMSERTQDTAERIGTEVGRYAAAFTKPIIWGLLVGGTGIAVLPVGPPAAVVAVVAVLLGCLKPPRGQRLLELSARSMIARLVVATAVVMAAARVGVEPNAFMSGAVLHLWFKALSGRIANKGPVVAVATACLVLLLLVGDAVVDPGVLLTSGDPFAWGAVLRDVIRVALVGLMVFSSVSDERKEAQVDAARADAVRDERARIARELHDVVAHHVSAMTIQAEAARSALPPGATPADRALAAAAAEGRTAMTELRTLLGVLRAPADDDDAAELGPQPSLEDLDALVADVRATGLDVRFVREAEADDDARLPPALRLSAFRIVQEALANVRRHAHATVVDVRVTTTGDALVVEVEDDGRGTGSFRGAGGGASSSTGYGILGMRERASLVGGTLESAPRGDGPGWRVRAVLPLQPVPA
jgi:signal transduction histidine kinase